MSDDTNPVVELFRSAIGRQLEGAPPVSQWLDGRIVSCGVGEIEVKFKVRPEMGNPVGLLHGGIQAAMMDEVIGMASATLGDKGFMLTIDLHTNFLGAGRGGGRPCWARARMVRTGRRISPCGLPAC